MCNRLFPHLCNCLGLGPWGRERKSVRKGDGHIYIHPLFTGFPLESEFAELTLQFLEKQC